MYNTITNSNIILRILDNAIIPADLNNSDYTQYLNWVSEGNTAEEISHIPITEVPADYEFPTPIVDITAARNLAESSELYVDLETIDITHNVV